MVRRRIRAAALALVLPVAFQAPVRGGGPPADPVTVARDFIRYLNAKDVRGILRVTTDPFLFRDQKWTNATDGSGFVLAEATEETVQGAKRRRTFFSGLVKKVSVMDTEGTAVDFATVERKELAGADGRWKGLVLVVFTRGFGDIGHTALVGVDKETERVRAFYVN